MRGRAMFLRPDVVFEPLVNHWYATAFSIAPMSLALHLRRSHLDIMRSYVNAPKVHAAALSHPEMLGGPYIDCDGEQVEEIAALVRRTEGLTEHLALADALLELQTLLHREATGGALEPFYARVPAPLRGMVELIYDLEHRPQVRFVEPLLYRGPATSEPLQSLRMQIATDDRRPFALSTPRLGGDAIEIERRLSWPVFDRLFASRYERNHPRELAESLELHPDQHAAFAALFTDRAASRVTRPVESEGLHVTFFGHASLLVRSKDATLLVDPWIASQPQGAPPRPSFADLPDWIDAVLITHGHADHMVLETLLQIRHRVDRVVVPRATSTPADPSLRLVLESLGFAHVIELDELQSVRLGETEIVGLPFFGEHADLNIRGKIGYRLSIRGRSIACMADANNLEPRLYERVAEVLGPTDVLFIGLECRGAPMSWVYTPFLREPVTRAIDQARRLDGSDADKAARMAQALGAKRARVYAIGTEPWTRYIVANDPDVHPEPLVAARAFVERCAELGIEADAMKVGVDVELP